VNTTAAFFEPSASIDSATGNLINSGTAANIQVRLLNGAGGNAIAGSPINLGAPDKMQNSGQYGITGGAATMNYYAQYVANGGAAGAGNVNTSVKFTLEYP
jgi:major type 1 subunit fimbrin (pilin)